MQLCAILSYTSWSKQEEGRGKSVREQDRYQGIMAPHKIGNPPPFVKFPKNLGHMFLIQALDKQHVFCQNEIHLLAGPCFNFMRVNSWRWCFHLGRFQ